MAFKLSPWWKDLITKLLLLYVAIKVIGNVVSIVQGYLNAKNPLIPDYLVHYVAFPLYFLIALWITFFIVCLHLLRNEDRLKKWFYLVFIGILIYQLLETYVHQFLMFINPF
jgi:hypothetical protein